MRRVLPQNEGESTFCGSPCFVQEVEMKILVNSREMKECDTRTIESLKVPSLVLMERAALSVVEEIQTRRLPRQRCLVVCGQGNNGGDGLAVARILNQQGSHVTVYCPMKEKMATREASRQYEILREYGIPVVEELPLRERFSLVVDAIFGIGLTREVEGQWKKVIDALNEMEGCKVAVDIPSGINGDTGQVMGCAFRADLTVTFAYAKPGLLLYPGYAYSGRVVTKDIGIDQYSWGHWKPSAFFFEESDLSLHLPKRQNYSNKGSYGRVLVVAGRENMAGAAYFSGKAAAVTGCGLVKLLSVEENRTILQQLIPEAILETFSKEELEEALEAPNDKETFLKKLLLNLEWADVIVVGPGLGTGPKARLIVKTLLELPGMGSACESTKAEEASAGPASWKKPLILDADALNILSGHLEWRKSYPGPVIVTPHMGEMARLTGRSVEELRGSLPVCAKAFAKAHNVTCVLKDARTVTAFSDGSYYINTSGNNGMATGGAGDVLTGVIAGLIAQGVEPDMAAVFGVFLHGKAGDIMVKETGQYSMMASDLIEGIRQITRKEAQHEQL